jgi:hypothetical protein
MITATGAAIAAAGCVGAEASSAATAPPPSLRPPGTAPDIGLNPGETMAFEVRVAGVVAGEAQLAVGEIGDYQGRRAVVVKSRAATAGAAALIKHVVDEATTTIDMATGRPLALTTLVEQGDSKTTATAQFTDNVADITYQRSDEAAPHRLRIDFRAGAVTGGAQPRDAQPRDAQPRDSQPRDAQLRDAQLRDAQIHDAHTAMAQLRGWRAQPGAKRTVFVVGGRRLWRIDVTYAGQDTIGSAIGNRRAIRFTGESYRARRDFSPETAKPSRTFTVWLSDDADRVPLRVAAKTELGDIVMELTEYSR